MANRLKHVLPVIISCNQSAFIPGRLISDNILAAYETPHTMHSRMYGRVGYMALKLDMSKAYDRVEWLFLEKVMRKMGFESRWVNLVRKCVTIVSYSVIVNGTPVGLFKPSRGIRQWDPLSPYLFILCAEVLSSILSLEEWLGHLKGVPTSFKGLRINYLFFADDSLLFCKATEQEWNCLKGVLEAYEEASGQRLNNDKTSVFFSRNTSQETKDRILEVVGVPDSQRFDTYLGLSALVGKSRTQEFQSLLEKVMKRVADWKTKFLSQAGNEVLIKAVIQTIASYSMSIFLLPSGLCKELNKLMQKFWWGHKENDKKIHWMSWERMGRAKNVGGLGFRDLICFNKALLAKQCWRLLQYPYSLAAKIIKAKYYSTRTLLLANLRSKPSFTWRSLLVGRELLEEGLIWRIGNGTSVQIRGDKWIPLPITYTTQTCNSLIGENALVAELMEENPRQWNRHYIVYIFQSFGEEEATAICNLPLSRHHHDDKMIWRATNSGEFSVKSAYHLEKERLDRLKGECSTGVRTQAVWKMIWGLKVPHSAQVFLWRACNKILPTKDNLKKRKVVEDDICIFCCSAVETTHHILWDYPSSQDVWCVSNNKLQKCRSGGNNFCELVEYLMGSVKREEMELFAMVAKRIWKRHNEVVHGDVFSHPSTIARQAIDQLQLYRQVNERQADAHDLS
ncbi:uncharacterized protein LOC132169451 [Corylus avellana]|uniref:uncharacterized protein LOC132169451 n=1 Tax=Corylus avellana TaxID=13451 RepID=UPI00286B7031|nr:uncharacterized protein LOC132169451 [Corylus avellana]